MKKEEVIDWLMIMKANLNSFPPEVSGVRKIEALAEAIRLIKNEQSIDKIDCDNADCNNCVNHKYCDYESNKSEIPTGSATKNDLGVREFEEIVVEYPPEDLCTYPEYKGKPYFSIKYKEGNDCFIGYGTYNPKVFSKYLRDYFTLIKNDLGVELIDRAELLKAMDTWDKFGYTARYGLERLDKDDKDFVPYVKYDDMVNCVKNMPPATPIRPKGHWISHSEHCEINNLRPSGLGCYFWCSECDCGIDYKYFHTVNYQYCPNCGAKMRTSED